MAKPYIEGSLGQALRSTRSPLWKAPETKESVGPSEMYEGVQNWKEAMLQVYHTAFLVWNELLQSEILAKESGLSKPQFKSLLLLRHWVALRHTERNSNETVSDSGVSLSLTDQWISLSATLQPEDVALFADLQDLGLGAQIDQNPARKSLDSPTTALAKPSSSTQFNYDHVMSALFKIEFGLYDLFDEIGPGDWWIDRLTARRRTAALETSCYNMAAPCLRWWRQHMNANYQSGTAGNTINETSSPIKLRTLGTVNSRTVTSNSMNNHHELPADHSRRFLQAGPRFDNCSWLDTEKGFPFFLWDIKNRCTVETSKIAQEEARYTAVSHTWGRWRLKHKAPVHVEGVNGWLIPENEIFAVQKLPEILEKVPTRTPYVWFDLVCIPQDGSKKADEEIARQAVIFENAETSVVWLNKLNDWSGVQAMLHWASLKYMHYSTFSKEFEAAKYFSAAFSQAMCPTNLFKPYEYNADTKIEEMESVGWFTSLWTLQEVCLRPDMLLCDANWTLLEATPGTPVSIEDLVALTNEITIQGPADAIMDDEGFDFGSGASSHGFDPIRQEQSRLKRFQALIRGGKYPRAFLEVYEILERTSMKELSFMRPETLILLGSERYCENSRAEAIMSVLGVTDWYTQGLDANHKGKQAKKPNDYLVLDTYPLAFLRAVAKKVGARFYNTVIIRDEEVTNCDQLFSTMKGTLLPFRPQSSNRQELRSIARWGFDEKDCVSVDKHYQIQADGSVKISSAVILASSSPLSIAPLDKKDDGNSNNDDDDENRRPRKRPRTSNSKTICEVCLAFPLDASFKPHHALHKDDRLHMLDIQQWADEWHPETKMTSTSTFEPKPTPNYAIVLNVSNIPSGIGVGIAEPPNKIFRGVLLKQIPGQDPGILIKVGLFITSGLSPVVEKSVSPETVDWTVL